MVGTTVILGETWLTVPVVIGGLVATMFSPDRVLDQPIYPDYIVSKVTGRWTPLRTLALPMRGKHRGVSQMLLVGTAWRMGVLLMYVQIVRYLYNGSISIAADGAWALHLLVIYLAASIVDAVHIFRDRGGKKDGGEQQQQQQPQQGRDRKRVV